MTGTKARPAQTPAPTLAAPAYSVRVVTSNVRCVEVSCTDGHGGTTPGVVPNLLRMAASIVRSRQTKNGDVFLGLSFSSDDSSAWFSLFFDHDGSV